MMSVLAMIGRIATEFTAARTRYQTERQLRALPPEIQKDIGWPEPADSRKNSHGAGNWAGAR
jgi:hypothetical protein